MFTMFISLPGGAEIFLLAFALVYLVAIIRTIILVIRREDLSGSTKLLWIILIAVAPLLGMLIYYFAGHRITDARS